MAKEAKKNKILLGNVQDFEEKEIETIDSQKKNKKHLRFIADERFQKAIGVLFMLFALYLFIACLSFLFTWQADQSIVQNLSWYMFAQIDPNIADNLLGKIGAWLGYIFVYRSFGISSFAFCVIFLSLGIFLIAKQQTIPIIKTLRYSFFGVIWLSLSLGFLLGNINPMLGGSFGFFGYLYLKALLGGLGTGLLLVAYALVFCIAVFNIKLYKSNSIVNNDILITDDEKDTLSSNKKTKKNIVENFPLDENNFVLKPIDENTTIESIEDLGSISINSKIEEEHITPNIDIIDENASTLKTESGLVLQVNEAPKEEEPIALPRKEHYGIDELYDPTLDFSNYQFPSIDLLNDYADTSKGKVEQEELSEKTKMIEDTLKNYSIGIKKISATVGPTVTLYEIIPQDGIRIAKIKNLEDDIALSLAALGIRIIAPIPGRGTIGIEVPNTNPAMVPMRAILSSSKFQNADMDLPIGFGKTISNEVFVADLAKMPHLLMAGATGQGKSVGLNTILVSLLYKKHPSQIKFVLVDPKKVELSIYKMIERHFLAKIPGDAEAIITDTKLVVNTLNSLCKEMDDRYDLLKDAQVRNLKEYNAKFISRRLPPTDKTYHRFLPYIVVVIDELADLMMTAGKEVEYPVARIAQLARAVGIHLILATQRPSVNIITGTIKANFPARIAFRVSRKIDSRTILDANGADQLIGKGDMLFSNGNDLVRLQCAFVDTPEVEKIANFIGNQNGNEPYLLPEVKMEGEDFGGNESFDSTNRDELFEDAARLIVVHQQGSTSLIQRKLNLGYNRAGRLIDQLEKAGIVGPFKGSKAREVLVHTEAELEEMMKGW